MIQITMIAAMTNTQLGTWVPAIDVLRLNHSMNFLPKHGPIGDSSTVPLGLHDRSVVDILNFANGGCGEHRGPRQPDTHSRSRRSSERRRLTPIAARLPGLPAAGLATISVV